MADHGLCGLELHRCISRKQPESPANADGLLVRKHTSRLIFFMFHLSSFLCDNVPLHSPRSMYVRRSACTTDVIDSRVLFPLPLVGDHLHRLVCCGAEIA